MVKFNILLTNDKFILIMQVVAPQIIKNTPFNTSGAYALQIVMTNVAIKTLHPTTCI